MNGTDLNDTYVLCRELIYCAMRCLFKNLYFNWNQGTRLN